MTRQQSDWLETALPERPDRWERRRRLTRILLPLLALLVIAAGILFGPRLLESPKPTPKKPTVVTVKPLGRTPTIAAAPAQAQPAAVNPDAIVADSSPSVPRAQAKAPTPPVQRSTASQPARAVTSQPAPGANSQPATTVQAKPAPTAPTATAQDPAADGAPSFTRELRYVRSGGRMYGEDVRRMQVRLMQLTGEDITKGGDGWFGPRTERGVRQFQERNGLPVTGVVDARTWAALFGTNAR